MSDDELKLVQWFRAWGGRLTRAAQPQGPDLAIDVGDDMAALAFAGSTFLLSTDMLLEGVHFERSQAGLAQIGRKATYACLSDCAAMAVRPVAILASLALPRRELFETGRQLLESMVAAASEFHCPLIGGDVTSWDQPLAIDVTVLAEPWSGVIPVTRAGARDRDLLYVTGSLGGSLLHKHMTFTPRIHEARLAAEALGPDLHAMIDISDGLALDLHRICQASRCGAVLDEDKLRHVISQDAWSVAGHDAAAAVQLALSDGEDYELLMAVAPRAVQAAQHLDIQLRRVGHITAGGFKLKRSSGALIDLEPRGYTH